MFGGPPMMPPPNLFRPMPAQGYPAPLYVNQVPSRPPAVAPAWQQAPAPRPEPAQPPEPQRPVFRGQAPDEPEPPPRRPVIRLQSPDEAEVESAPQAVCAAPPTPLTLPSPEQLGVDQPPCAESAPLDWAEIHRRLDRLGALSFHQQKLTDAGLRVTFRVTFLLPTEQPNRVRQVEAEAGTVAQAVNLALSRAEQGSGRQ